MQDLAASFWHYRLKYKSYTYFDSLGGSFQSNTCFASPSLVEETKLSNLSKCKRGGGGFWLHSVTAFESTGSITS
jgi:hypothetical protein